MGQGLALETLLQDPRLWRGRAAPPAKVSLYPTGYAALDAVLPSGGWPAAALSEILLAADGLGELGLLLPTLAALTQQARPVLMVAPPYRPYLPALQAAGVRATQLYVLQASTREAPWVMEQCLRAGACGAVLGWLPTDDARVLRRLQLAAESGATLGFLFRRLAAATQASPAALRVALETDTRGTSLRVLKCRGGLTPTHALRYTPATWH